jgi:TP901 family phage tail tape measure protein
MSSAAAVRAGLCFVEIRANDGPFIAAMARIHNRVAALARTLLQVGSIATAGGLAIGTPLVMAARSAATFEDALLELKASANDITPDQFNAARDAALQMSREMGVSADDTMRAITLLVKAGMSVEDALDGAARSAVQFGKVGGVAAEDAAVFMNNAMTIFGVSAKEAVDTLSAAADSTPTKISEMVEAFGQIGATGQQFGQSLFGIAQAMGAVSKAGIVGEEAGTAIKTLLGKLVSQSDEASEALGRMGLSAEAFRDKATGTLLPIAQIADIFGAAIGRMSKSQQDMMMKDKALVDVFDMRGLKVINTLAALRKEGMDKIAADMEKSRTVAEKFAIVMEGLSGFFSKVQTAAKLISIGFGEAMSKSLASVGDSLVWAADGIRLFIERYPALAKVLSLAAVGMTVFGITCLFASAMMWGVTTGFKFIIGSARMIARGFVMISVAIWRMAYAAAALQAFLNPRAILIGLGALATAAGAIYLLRQRATDEPPSAPNDLKRDKPRDPMAAPGDAARAGQKRGEAASTLVGQIASRLGVGPSLNAMDQTAENTRRAADALDEIKGKLPAALGAPVIEPGVAVPPAAALRQGMNREQRANAGIAGRLSAVNTSERAALNSEKTVDLLRRILAATEGRQLAFA